MEAGWKKWIYFYENDPVIMFHFDLSTYNDYAKSDSRKTNLEKSATLFDELVNSNPIVNHASWASPTTVILVLSGSTQFGEKFDEDKFKKTFPFSYTGDKNGFRTAISCIKQRFLGVNKRDVAIQPHVPCTEKEVDRFKSDLQSMLS